MKPDVDVLRLCDAALEIGRTVAADEKRVNEVFADAKSELQLVLREIIKAAGGSLRGHDECEQESGYSNKTKTNRIYLVPGTMTTSGPYVDGRTGEIGNCPTPEDLAEIWRALPTVMFRHISACEHDLARNRSVMKELATVWHGCQALRSFGKEVMPQHWKDALMERAISDADLQDALRAAVATGDDNAPLKVLREQMRSADESEDEDKDEDDDAA